MECRISSKLLGAILAQVRASDREVCGLLIGREGLIEEVQPCRNVATDPRRRFEIDPGALLAAHRRARAGGLCVVGHYHSHPSSKADPSAGDAAEAPPDGALWLIVAGGECRAWHAAPDGAVQGRFNPVPLVVRPPCAPPSAPPEGRR